MQLTEIKSFLDEKAERYNRPEFIESDPVQVPHRFSQKEDIEISAFLTALISWGNRTSIIKSAMYLMQLMDHQPFDFITSASNTEFGKLQRFTYRTFNGMDCEYIALALNNVYQKKGGLHTIMANAYREKGTIKAALARLYDTIFEIPGERTRKHIANVESGASAKRLNMFLRWMVRDDNRGVDFGLWPDIPPSALMLPLDLHTGTVARKLGLLKRKQNDWKAVEEITRILQTFDPDDPVKYDYALFGLGIFERF